MKYLYRIYQTFIFAPLFIVLSLVLSLATAIGCAVGNGHFWGYYPGKWWARISLWLLLIPVKVTGRENLKKGQSYVFVANHQGAFDIFLIYGHLNRNFKWMMKKALRKIPLVGYACEASHQIFVDKTGPSKIRKTYEQARETLKEGMSLVVFPEGARTFTGHMGFFRRGAFMLADELQLPVVPLTINGSFDMMPRMRDWHYVVWHPMTLTIHKPIPPQGKGKGDIQQTMDEAYKAIMSSLAPKYQGYVENDDQ